MALKIFLCLWLQPLMDQYFERIQQLLSRSDFPSRIRFMIEDVIDLRNAKVNMWMLENVPFSFASKPTLYKMILVLSVARC